MTKTLKYKGSLANRTAAAQERAQIEALAQQGEQVILDYSEVISLSGSYADELFGVFTQRHGTQALRSSLKVKGASQPVAHAIGLAIQHRMPASAA
ncbi:STAS-like domain-containing protein [Halomonas desiderata]|uniref:STAS-like domain-containing protein n=1 Tax=Billgrantia desiderata TaxID=52021 RepID=UPI0017499520|nr:STAS-like domain-containing protein [Halomonas desiderata]